MKRLISQLTTKNAKVSALFYAGSFALNIGNYFFHLVLLRLLTPSDYGEFLSYISFLYLLTIPSSTISMLVVKYVASYYGQQKWTEISTFFYYILKKVFIPGIIISILTILFSEFLAAQLKAQPLAFVILGLSILTSFFGAVVNAYMSALQKFVRQIGIGFVEMAVKISFAAALILSGWGAVGGVIAWLSASIVGVLLSFFQIRPLLKAHFAKEPQTFTGLNQTLIYSLILSGGTLSLVSIDVLLVRYFFEPHLSGIYSGLSILSRMIFFGVSPLISLILPVVSHRFTDSQPTKPVLFKLGSVILILGGIGVTIFTVIPRLMISILSGSQYLEAAPWLGFAALTMLLLALNRLQLDYFMAINRQRATLILLASIIIQPLAVIFFHQSLSQIIFLNLGIQILLFLSLASYFQLALRQIK